MPQQTDHILQTMFRTSPEASGSNRAYLAAALIFPLRIASDHNKLNERYLDIKLGYQMAVWAFRQSVLVARFAAVSNAT